MTAKTIPGNEFFKALGRLEAFAGSGKEEEMQKAQLFHTPSDSERTSWAGGSKKEIGNKWDDSIGNDGTDYHPARKSIAEKALKGIPLSPEEIAILKSDIEEGFGKGGFPFGKDDDKDDDKKGDDKEKSLPQPQPIPVTKSAEEMTYKATAPEVEVEDHVNKDSFGKSFSVAVGQSESIQKGLEISEFLTDLVKAFGAGIGGVEQRTTALVEEATNVMLNKLGSYMDSRFEEQAGFNKSLAEAIVNIGHGVAGNISTLNEVAQAPAGAPKSQLRAVHAVEKSFGGPAGESISKAQKLDALVDMVEKGKINSLEVLKFETTGQLRPDLDALITSHVQSGGKQ